jgi:hypothetical protein
LIYSPSSQAAANITRNLEFDLIRPGLSLRLLAAFLARRLVVMIVCGATLE